VSVFYQRFERHSHGEGLKGQSTHYCAGCGHGLVHKYVADAIEELAIQDDTVLVSPVGCSVFAYYYFDTGNTQAAHGRAAAVAIGHKLANPNAVVISYQGDGDLASIGLAETVNAAQLGLPITVVFINNATYGMTGGQMAPTTLMGQVSATSPLGRNRMNGEPMKMAELIASLDGPVYVERVALYWPAGRLKAARAIKKAVRLQKEGKGYAFIEVLAECPTMLRLTPDKAEQWVKENMVPVFPLGVKKDLTEKAEPWFELRPATFASDSFLHAVEATTEAPKRFCKGFPAHLDPSDVSLKLAGAGGDGAQTAAMLVSIAAINEGFDGTHIPSYGPESRGGTSYADVHVAKDEVLNPASPSPHVLIAFNAPSLARFGLAVKPGGFILYDSSVAKAVKVPDPTVKVIGVPFTEIAAGLGKLVVKNVVALGALQATTKLFPKETFLSAIREALKEKPKLIPLNEQAFQAGVDAVQAAPAKS
jgi:2-oxoisovalerate ferredoxin oxidoreductase beta subunit